MRGDLSIRSRFQARAVAFLEAIIVPTEVPPFSGKRFLSRSLSPVSPGSENANFRVRRWATMPPLGIGQPTSYRSRPKTKQNKKRTCTLFSSVPIPFSPAMRDAGDEYI